MWIKVEKKYWNIDAAICVEPLVVVDKLLNEELTLYVTFPDVVEPITIAGKDADEVWRYVTT